MLKMIVGEVKRDANRCGCTHEARKREAYDQMAGIVHRAQAGGALRGEIDPPFAALAFYGLVEQVLTRWIFESEPVDEQELERAKRLIVEMTCLGLER